jgi:general secretion pathway protein B
VPAYYDLPFATRKALPQLSMSMHVYAADSKQRFVILDGARMVEGDTTTDRVTLREIRPDGVILEFQGQRFFFPRDGL